MNRLWQAAGETRYRIDDSHSSPRQLDLKPAHAASLVLEVIGVRSDDGDTVHDVTVCVGILDLLAALQGCGVTVPQVAGVWGLDPFATTQPVGDGSVTTLAGTAPDKLRSITRPSGPITP